MARRLSLVLLLPLVLSGCAHLPYFKRWAKKKYLPLAGHPMFSFEYPRRWGSGHEIPGGLEFRDPKGRGLFSIVYFEEGSKQHKPPDLYRQYMASWGAVEDEHRVHRVAVSTHAAYRVRFTTYEYDPQYLLGESVRVYLTETTLIPYPYGIFVLRYHASREHFWRKDLRRHYEHFLRSISLVRPRRDDDLALPVGP